MLSACLALCINTLSPYKFFSFLHVFGDILVFASGTGCIAIEALELNLFHRIYSLFVLGKGNVSEEYIVLLKRWVPSFFFFFCSYCFIKQVTGSLCTEH